MKHHYTELSDTDTSNIFNLIDNANPDHGFHKKHTKMFERPLIFAPGWTEIIMEDYSSVPFKKKTYIKKNKELRPLIYSSDPYKDNDFVGLSLFLNHDAVTDYINFYCRCLVTSSGKLQTIQNYDDVNWQDDLSPQARQAIEKDLLSYPRITEEGESFTVDIPCTFKQSIMIITFLVHEDGTVDILNRRSLIDDLPIRNFS
jgi:hypothetical protein